MLVRPPPILLSACTPSVRHEAGLQEQPFSIFRWKVFQDHAPVGQNVENLVRTNSPYARHVFNDLRRSDRSRGRPIGGRHPLAVRKLIAEASLAWALPGARISGFSLTPFARQKPRGLFAQTAPLTKGGSFLRAISSIPHRLAVPVRRRPVSTH